MSKVKAYSLEHRASMPSRGILALIGAPRHVMQASAVFTGMTKAEAAAAGTAAGFYGCTARALRLAMGNQTQALERAGLLGEPGRVYVWRDFDGPIALVRPDGRAAIIGTLEQDQAFNAGMGYRVVLIPAREALAVLRSELGD